MVECPEITHTVDYHRKAKAKKEWKEINSHAVLHLVTKGTSKNHTLNCEIKVIISPLWKFSMKSGLSCV